MVIGLIIGIIILFIILIWIYNAVNIVRPTERGIVETLGKYSHIAQPGLNFVFPILQKLYRINITEQMAEIDTKEYISEDNLNVKINLVVFHKVKEDDLSLQNSIYNVYNFTNQIDVLAQTTARDAIGGMAFKDVNSKRNLLNGKLLDTMKKETADWGVEIIRVELREITPPEDVQEKMNLLIKAESEKRAATDYATAQETRGDGEKRMQIKLAEGLRQSEILRAEGDKTAQILRAEGAAKAFNLVNASFKGNAQKLKQFETMSNALQNNTKIVLGDNGKNLLKLFDINKIGKE